MTEKKQAPELDEATLDAVRGGAQFNPKEIKISDSVPWKADRVTDWPKTQELRS